MSEIVHTKDTSAKGATIMYPVKAIAGAIAVIAIGIIFWMTYYTVRPYERAVLTRFGQLVAVNGEGLHFKIPLVNSVTYIRTDLQTISPRQPANTYTIDNQEVDIVFNLFYRVPADKIEFIYRNVQDYKERLEAMAIDRLKAEMGKVNVAHVAEKRGELRDQIKSVLVRDAADIGIQVTDFQLTNLDYTKSFKAAVEQAAAAKAMVETREQELQQSKKQAEQAAIQAEGRANALRAQARGDAEANATRARGEAEARLLIATAEARAIQLRGEAEAAAIKAQADALTANAQLVELRKAEKWNGSLPATMLSNVVPFMGVDQTGIKK
jgi:regulator of protease activity HflC (stomatin/prohibitin superfamily)